MSKEPKRNVYVGHRYVPKIIGEWNKLETYEGLSIVTYQGASYTSKKRVPAGIDILNEEYWTVTGNYNAQVDQYRQDVRDMKEEVESKASTIYVDNEILSVTKKINDTVERFTDKEINIVKDWHIKDGIDQSSELQYFIDNLEDNTVLFFPNKRFNLKGITFSNKRNIKIYGENTEIVNYDSDENIFNINNCDNITIEGFNFISEWGKMTSQYYGQSIYCNNVSNIFINNNKSKRGGIGVTIGNMVFINNNIIYDNDKFNQFGIVTRDVKGLNIVGNYVSDCIEDGIKISMELDTPNRSVETLIDGNHISNCGDDCIDTFSGGHKCTITNNFFYNSYRGVQAKEWGSPIETYKTVNEYANDIIISNNHFRDNRIAVTIGCTNALINNNIVTNEPKDGFAFIIWGRNVSIDNNIVNGLERAVIIQEYSQYKVDNVKITNNQFLNLSNWAITADPGVGNIYIDNCLIKNIGNMAILSRSDTLTIRNTDIIESTDRAINYVFQDPVNSRFIAVGVQIINEKKDIERAFSIPPLNSVPIENGMITGCYVLGATQPIIGGQNIIQSGNNWNINDNE